jgi:hypothetical protein
MSKSTFFFNFFLAVFEGEKIDIFVGLNTPGPGDCPFQIDPAQILIGLAPDFLNGDATGDVK